MSEVTYCLTKEDEPAMTWRLRVTMGLLLELTLYDPFDGSEIRTQLISNDSVAVITIWDALRASGWERTLVNPVEELL